MSQACPNSPTKCVRDGQETKAGQVSDFLVLTLIFFFKITLTMNNFTYVFVYLFNVYFPH